MVGRRARYAVGVLTCRLIRMVCWSAGGVCSWLVHARAFWAMLVCWCVLACVGACWCVLAGAGGCWHALVGVWSSDAAAVVLQVRFAENDELKQLFGYSVDVQSAADDVTSRVDLTEAIANVVNNNNQRKT